MDETGKSPRTKNRKKKGQARTYLGRDLRQELLDAAVVVFKRKGYVRTGVNDITQAAGCSHGSFYNYFKNKDDIFKRIITPVFQEFRVAWKPWPIDDPVAGIRDTINNYLEIFRRNAALSRVMWEAGITSRVIGRTFAKARRPVVDYVATNIATLQQAGWATPSLSAAALADILCGAVTHYGLARWVINVDPGEVPDIDEAVDLLTYSWVTALRAPGREPAALYALTGRQESAS